MIRQTIRTFRALAPIILAGCAVPAQLSDLAFEVDRQVYVLQQAHRLQTSAQFLETESEYVTEGEFAGVYDTVFEGIQEAFGQNRVHMLGDTKGPQDIEVWLGEGSLDLTPYVGAILVGIAVDGTYFQVPEANRYRLELSTDLQFAEVIDDRARVYPKAIGGRRTGMGDVAGPLIPGSTDVDLEALKEAYPITSLAAELADSTRVAMDRWLSEFRAPAGN